ncbi:MAG: hypothetical protein LBN05_08440 [Oscillospiraceae bacterium]|jgi:hypothetical protein|nr:hypothetical protein [Oscillospiraceae bacterium]
MDRPYNQILQDVPPEALTEELARRGSEQRLTAVSLVDIVRELRRRELNGSDVYFSYCGDGENFDEDMLDISIGDTEIVKMFFPELEDRCV